jgi:transcriptional regulator
MYTPRHFKENDPEKIKAFMRENDFATLVTWDGSMPVATHLLVEVVEQGEKMFINGHIARANDQWKTFLPEREALVIFGGPHTYISPRWYSQVNVPTWNYIAVHAYGIPQAVTDLNELRGILARLVDRYEAGSGANPPYSVDALPEGYMEKHMQGVVGLKIEITRLEAKAKLSQNRDEADVGNVIHELEKRPDEKSRQIASAMRRNKTLPKK